MLQKPGSSIGSSRPAHQPSLCCQARSTQHGSALLLATVRCTDLAAPAAVSPCKVWNSCLSTSLARGSSWALHRRILPGPDQIDDSKKPYLEPWTRSDRLGCLNVYTKGQGHLSAVGLKVGPNTLQFITALKPLTDNQ